MSQTISKAKQVELTEKHIEVMENFERLLESGIVIRLCQILPRLLKFLLELCMKLHQARKSLLSQQSIES